MCVAAMNLEGLNSDLQFTEFTRICQHVYNVNLENDNAGNIESILQTLNTISNAKLREACIIHLLETYPLPEQGTDLIIRLHLNNLIKVVLITMTELTISSFCEKFINFFRKVELLKLTIYGKDHNLKLFLKKLMNILKKRSSPVHLSNSICKFLLFIEPLFYNRMLQLNIVEVISKRFSRLWTLLLNDDTFKISNQLSKNKSLHGYHSVSLNSKVDYYTEPLSQFLFLYTHIISSNTNEEFHNTAYHSLTKIIPIPNEFLVGLLSLTTAYNYEVSWAATCVLIEYNLPKEEIKDIVRLVHPLVLDLISRESISKIKFQNIVSKYNIPLTLMPLSLLVKLLKVSPPLTTSLNDLNYIQTINELINRSYNSNKKHLSIVESYKFSMCLTILSFLGATKDKAKLSISKGDSNGIISKSLELHGKILHGWPKPENVTTRHLKVLRISNRLTYASCLVLRSLSRSASLLRTYFSSNNLFELLTYILEFDIMVLNNLMPDSENTAFLRELSLETLILGVLSNLVIEFSSTRDQMNIDKVLSLLKLYIQNAVYENTLIAVLSIVRNALFGNDQVFKSKFLEIIGLDEILKLCNNENVEIQTQSFNCLRNLLADSMGEGNKIFDEFDIFMPEYDLFEFLRLHLHNSHSDNLTKSICYCLVHLAASDINNKIGILKNKLLLNELLEILLDPIKNDSTSDISWEIKTCIAWIIIDLTYKEGSNNNNYYKLTRYSDDEAIELSDVANRSRLLMKLGFHDALKKMASSCSSLDFTERAGKAIFQMIVSTGSD